MGYTITSLPCAKVNPWKTELMLVSGGAADKNKSTSQQWISRRSYMPLIQNLSTETRNNDYGKIKQMGLKKLCTFTQQ